MEGGVVGDQANPPQDAQHQRQDQHAHHQVEKAALAHYMEVAARGLASLAQVVDALLPHDAGRHHGQQDATAQQQPADTHLPGKGNG